MPKLESSYQNTVKQYELQAQKFNGNLEVILQTIKSNFNIKDTVLTEKSRETTGLRDHLAEELSGGVANKEWAALIVNW